MSLEEILLDSSFKQKKGLHFILASIILWSIIAYIHSSSLPILTKNFYTFCTTGVLVPLAFLISKLIKVDFSNKSNPLTNLGILFSMNQMLYLLIAMWVYAAIPDKMVMILAMIFGAHLLPYGWLYKSKTYYVLSVFIPIATLMVGVNYPSYIVAGFMIFVEILFSLFLYIEVKRLPKVM